MASNAFKNVSDYILKVLYSVTVYSLKNHKKIQKDMNLIKTFEL